MRGPPDASVPEYFVYGIIPAYAGTTCPCTPSSIPRWDHPRLCGDHVLSLTWFGSQLGSSPPMRGPLRNYSDGNIRCGIIPAYAGTTIFIVTYRYLIRDHPRLCGDHLLQRLGHPLQLGSSPPMRGPRYIVRAGIPRV